MSQRDSGYERKERDCYETPEWVTRALIPHLRGGLERVWEPACGSGKMVRALEGAGYRVVGSDISDGSDFFAYNCQMNDAEAIITNPPYEHAEKFIAHAIRLTADRGMVAMLLRTDFDHAKGRHYMFKDQPTFAKKLVLTKRIRWFEDSKGSPSFNHAWFIWDWKYRNSPVIAYD